MKAERLALVAMTSVLGVAVTASADIIWDQQPTDDPSTDAFVDQEFGDFPDFSTYLVNDVVLGANATINSITVYFTNNPASGDWPLGPGMARLNIFADDGGLDTEDPTTGTMVAVNIAAGGIGLEITASGLDIDLTAGTYWIGLTPVFDFAANGQQFHQAGASGVIGAETHARNPGGGFGLGTSWATANTLFGGNGPYDSALTIEGVIPTPGALALLGLAGLASRRRRR